MFIDLQVIIADLNQMEIIERQKKMKRRKLVVML